MGVSMSFEDSCLITHVMDAVIPVGALNDATILDFRNKGLLADQTFLRPQSGNHLRRGQPSDSARTDGAAAGGAATAKRAHCARPKRPAFDGCSVRLLPRAVEEEFRRCGADGEWLFDQIAAVVTVSAGWDHRQEGKVLGDYGRTSRSLCRSPSRGELQGLFAAQTHVRVPPCIRMV